MIMVYGKGKTGESIVSFLKKKGIPYLWRDDKDFNEDEISKVKQIIVSPGIPFYHKIYRLSKKNQIETVGDVEFAYRLYKGKIIAITGTDGKSTTTYMTGKLLEKYNPFIGGNYGEPFIKAVEFDKKLSVLELSSFQIYATKTFRPNIGVLLNISTDHLDWHKRKSHYLLSKYKMFKRMSKLNTAIMNFDQEIIRKARINAKKLYFSLEKLPSGYEGIYLCSNSLVFNVNRTLGKIDISDFKLKGEHNIQNLMASVLTALIEGIPIHVIEEQISELEALPYRIQFLKRINGVLFYNDSKSTTVQSVIKAVKSFNDRKINLIIGGIYKGGDFSELKKFRNIKKIYIIGKDKYVLMHMLKTHFSSISLKNSLEEAIKDAYLNAEIGDVVLFSPGCSSFDMFKNYKERGEFFNKLVEKLSK